MNITNGRTTEGRQFEDQMTQSSPALVRELWNLLRHNKKWWLTPILVVLVLLGMLVIIGGTAMAPFVYTIF